MGNQVKKSVKQAVQQKQRMTLLQRVAIGGGVSVGLILIFFLIFKLGSIEDAAATSSGEYNPSSATNSGGSGRSWTNPSNVYSSNNSDAYRTLSSSGGNRRSEYLEVTDFSFAIPATATIDGIEVTVECAASSSSSISDEYVYLTKDGSSSVTSNYASGSYWNSFDTDFDYGGTSDLWGSTWTAAEVNSSDFGVLVRARNYAGSNRTAYIDHVTVTVHYTDVSVNGPGGVASNMELWLDANTAVTGTTQISSWGDQSGNGNDASMGTSTYRPALESDYVNFNNAVDFDGGDEYMQGSAGGYTDEMFVVLIPDAIINSSASSQVPFSTNSVNSVPATYIGFGTSTGAFADEVITWGVGGSTTWRRAVTGSTSYASGDPMILNVSNDDGGSATTIYHNQTSIANNSNGSYENAENNEPYRIGGNCYEWGGSYYNGKIAEVITYSADLSAAKRRKVASYLAIKFGITLDDDYDLSDGTTIWDQGNNSSYHNDVAGIAQDVLSNLDQQKSKSENSDAAITVDKGGSFPSDLDAIIWGNDNGTQTKGTSNGSSNYADASNRTWKVELNGSPGDVSIDIDLSQLSMTGGVASDYALLIDDNTNFTSGATEHTAGAVLNGTTLTFTSVSLVDGYYFTVAQKAVVLVADGPGGVDTDLELWLRADSDVFENSGGSIDAENGDDVYVWGDQSVNSNNASAAGSTGNRPEYHTANMNFNPSIEFDDASSGNRYLETASNPATDDMSWFVVYRSNQSSSSGSWWANPALIGGEASGSGLDYAVSLTGGKPYWKGTSGDNFGSASASTYNDNRGTLLTATRQKTSSGTNYLYVNGTQTASYAADDNSLNALSTLGIGNHHDPATGSQFDGEIAEVVGYSSQLGESDRNKIESYLAMKYGITIDHDYVSSGGTVIWDQGDNTDFHNRITAIGRDDEAALDQRQSVGWASDAVVTIGHGGIAASNSANSNSFSANNSYVIFGDNNDVLTGVTETDQGTTTNAEVIDRRISRSWLLEEGGTVGSVELTFDLHDFPGVRKNASTYDFTELRLLIDGDGTFSTGAYSVSPTSFTYSSSDTTITFNHNFSAGTSYFSLGTLDEAGSPLPVEFSYFSAQAIENGAQVELNWSTATETNNDFFKVERSADGYTWESLFEVDGAGTSIQGLEYKEYDQSPLQGTSYYRLKQVDFDGTTDYSKIEQVIIGGAERQGTMTISSVYPNPFVDQLTLDIELKESGSLTLDLLNANGNQIKTEVFSVVPGTNSLTIRSLSDLPKGTYIVKARTSTLSKTKTVIKR